VSPAQPHLSFAVTCMNRLYQLRESILLNLDTLAQAGSDIEMILLDYGSTDGLGDWIQSHCGLAMADGRLTYVRVEAKYWHSSKAKNLAHRFARGEYLFNLDADNFLSLADIELLRRQWREDPFGVVWQWSGNWPDGTCGRIGVRRADFIALGGYDEQLPPAGGQDLDLLARARTRGHRVHRHVGGRAIANSTAEKMANVDGEGQTFSEMNSKALAVTEERQRKHVSSVNEKGWGGATDAEFNFGRPGKRRCDFEPLLPEQEGDGTSQRWSRIVMNRECRQLVDRLNPAALSVLEISGEAWKEAGFRSYRSVSFPEYDLCADPLPELFDLIIAEQVFEYVLWPYRAGKNVFAMLQPGGHFLISTPFLTPVHDFPQDCSRWTELGLRYFLAECGFPLENTLTASWGNRQCIEANWDQFLQQYRPGEHSLENQPNFPYHVWALARR
jgi:SAM-dependent methyltransferase